MKTLLQYLTLALLRNGSTGTNLIVIRNALKKLGFICLLCTTPAWVLAQNSTDGAPMQKSAAAQLDESLLKAYEGDPDAQFKVAEMYANGATGKVDQEQAIYWYQKAAEQGNVLGQYNLGHHYLNGLGVDKNINTAMQWWLKAAKQNHVLAQFNVGRAYYLGIGLPEDAKSAKYWFERAAENKEPRSIAILEKLNSTNPIASTAPDEDRLKSVITPTDEVPSKPVTEPAPVPKPVTNSKPVATTQKPAAPAAVKPTPIATPVKAPVAKAKPAPEVVTQPVALYTNPSVSSIMISEIDDNGTLKVIKAGGKWSEVQSVSGFPVWIHGDFLKTDKNHGTVSGTSVNARANPKVSKGSVVGRFKKGERVLVVDQRDGWYQVISPTRFRAWAKTRELKKSS